MKWASTIPRESQKSNQPNLASRQRQHKLLRRWETSSFPLLWLSCWFRFCKMINFIPNNNAIQKLIFIMVKTFHFFFFFFFFLLWSPWMPFRLLSHALFSCKIWCADALPIQFYSAILIDKNLNILNCYRSHCLSGPSGLGLSLTHILPSLDYETQI